MNTKDREKNYMNDTKMKDGFASAEPKAEYII